MRGLISLALLLTACQPTRYALCEPDVKGCLILEVYDDPMQCGFVAMARNGKDYGRDNLECVEMPDVQRKDSSSN